MRFQSTNLLALFALCLSHPSLMVLSLMAEGLNPCPTLPSVETMEIMETNQHRPPAVLHKSPSPRTFALQVLHTAAAEVELDKSADLPVLQPVPLQRSAVSIPMG
jgi:hypothetical protein